MRGLRSRIKRFRVRPADSDPRQITLVFRSEGWVKTDKKWRLVYRNRSGAEKIVDIVRGLLEQARAYGGK